MKKIYLVPLIFGALVLAQTSPESDKSVSLSKVERKNKAPVSQELIKVKLPRPVEAKLDNGLTVLILENHKLPYVSMELVIDGAGPISEPAGQTGLASATAALMTQGTKSRSSLQIAEQTDRFGAALRVSSMFGGNTALISASGLSETMDKWFPLFVDVLLNPSFPEKELKNYQQRSLVDLKRQRSSPGFLASERFNRAVYGKFPASVISATPEFLQSMTPAMLASWHTEHYVPQNAIIGIAGDVKPAEMIALLKKSLADWKRNSFESKLPESAVPAAHKQIYLVNRPDSVQTNIMIGNIAMKRNNPDYTALRVANQILGEGPASRLFIKLREEKGYTYHVGSSLHALLFAGPWTASSEVRTEVTGGSMAEFFNELNRLCTEKAPANELADAKRTIIATFALSLESPSELLTNAIEIKRYGLPADYWDTYPTKISAITADDVMRVAKKYINPENAQIVVVGDASKIKAVMEKYGPVAMYDTEGKEMTP
ncbi:MAG TPA: pitrilysin family protein [Bryobacteraceae bacterium]